MSSQDLQVPSAFSKATKDIAGEFSSLLVLVEEELAFFKTVKEETLVRPPPGFENFKASVEFRVRAITLSCIFKTEEMIEALIRETNLNCVESLPHMARAIIETCARAYYTYRMIEPHKRKGKLDAIGEDLDRALLGAEAFGGPNGEKIRPVSILAMVSIMSDDFNDRYPDFRGDYTRISDFVHPNGPALALFHNRIREDGNSSEVFRSRGLNKQIVAEFLLSASGALFMTKDAWRWLLDFRWPNKA